MSITEKIGWPFAIFCFAMAMSAPGCKRGDQNDWKPNEGNEQSTTQTIEDPETNSYERLVRIRHVGSVYRVEIDGHYYLVSEGWALHEEACPCPKDFRLQLNTE
jgi:hypothetical protein